MVKRVLWFVSAALVATPASAQPLPAPPAPSAQASVAVPRNVLERYVGRYALNGTVATVSLTDDGRLAVRLEGQPPGPPLRAAGTSEFVNDAAGVRLFFEGDGPHATRLRSRYAGNEVIGTRIAAQASGPPTAGQAPTTLDAAARKATTLITAGGVQSNHARVTAATAVRLGMN